MKNLKKRKSHKMKNSNDVYTVCMERREKKVLPSVSAPCIRPYIYTNSLLYTRKYCVRRSYSSYEW